MTKAATGALALALALVPAALAAQSANDWRLPGATVRPAPPGSQGPVDRDNPVVTTAQPRPTQTAAPSPAPSPSASQPAPIASSAPFPTASRAAAPRQATPAPRPAGPAPAAAVAGPIVAPPTGQPAPPTTEAAPAAFPTGFAAPPVAAAPPELASAPGWYWPWVAGGTGLLALIFAGLWLRRRKVPEDAVLEFERPIVVAREPRAAPADEQQSIVAIPAPKPLPVPQLSADFPAGLGISLEARRMSASLMATTLSYAVKLTNTGTEALSALAVEGDMVSAHASLPHEAQVANDDQRLELRHALVTLAPGESAEFTGDFRLPLTAVTPIRSGNAAYFVPLARLRVEASTAGGAALVTAQTFVVGELPEDPSAALRPFRLDLGPRTYSKLGQRAVN